MKLSVPINGFWVPFTKTPDSILRFCHPLFFHKDHEIWELAFSGSSLRFRTGGRNFVLSTKHQYRVGRDHLSVDDACILVKMPEGWMGITANSAWRINTDHPYDRMATDLVLLEYDSVRDGRNIDLSFLQLDLLSARSLSEVDPASIKIIFGIGFPMADADYETTFDEDYNPTSLHMVNRLIKVLFSRESINFEPALEGRILLQVSKRFHPEGLGDPQGLSGSPVLFVWQDETRQCQLGFAGMITHGTAEGSFHLYPGQQIRDVVRNAVERSRAEKLMTPGR